MLVVMASTEYTSTPMGQILDRVVKALEESPLSRYQISKQTGIPESTLSRLVSGERRGLQMENLEKLCDVLGLELTGEARRRGKKRKGP